MKPVSYRSRDGLTIPGYLTLPPGRPLNGLPLVVLAHGGPFYRDTWEFDPWVQLLANRGYAVLQANFRGSTGYGRDYMARGFGEWGTGMINDLIDGVGWLAGDGIVDASRVCIMGASYGGYAAIWSAISAPQVYRCAISFAGVTDLEDLMRHDRNFFYPTTYRWWRRRIDGDAGMDLKAISPTDQAGQLSRPLLLVDGTEDRRVPVDQARKLRRVLQRADKPVEYLELPDVRHGFAKDADHIRFLSVADAFLARHNPAD